MKVGDLVRRRFVLGSIASSHSTEHHNNEAGIVVEVANNACKVIFTSRGGEIRSFIRDSLEVVSESR